MIQCTLIILTLVYKTPQNILKWAGIGSAWRMRPSEHLNLFHLIKNSWFLFTELFGVFEQPLPWLKQISIKDPLLNEKSLIEKHAMLLNYLSNSERTNKPRFQRGRLLCTVDSRRVAAGTELGLQTLWGTIRASFSKHTIDGLSERKSAPRCLTGRERGFSLWFCWEL